MPHAAAKLTCENSIVSRTSACICTISSWPGLVPTWLDSHLHVPCACICTLRCFPPRSAFPTPQGHAAGVRPSSAYRSEAARERPVLACYPFHSHLSQPEIIIFGNEPVQMQLMTEVIEGPGPKVWWSSCETGRMLPVHVVRRNYAYVCCAGFSQSRNNQILRWFACMLHAHVRDSSMILLAGSRRCRCAIITMVR